MLHIPLGRSIFNRDGVQFVLRIICSEERSSWQKYNLRGEYAQASRDGHTEEKSRRVGSNRCVEQQKMNEE